MGTNEFAFGTAAGVLVAIPILAGLHHQYVGYDFRKGHAADGGY